MALDLNSLQQAVSALREVVANSNDEAFMAVHGFSVHARLLLDTLESRND